MSANLERLLPMETIRQHTKTDDVPHVSDSLLELYREAAFEALEQYTGQVLAGRRQITEPFPVNTSFKARPMTVKLQHATNDGLVYVYGLPGAPHTRTYRLKPGAREFVVPVHEQIMILDQSGCDVPYREGVKCQHDYSPRMTYATGRPCEDLPDGMLLGCLKYIAWSVNNAGDEIKTVRNRERGGAAGIVGSNNVALSSGALELWRQYRATP